MKNLLCSIVVASSIAAPVAFAESQFGVFAALGQAKLSASFENSTSESNTDTSFAIGGLYVFNENFALEGRYEDFGTFDYSESYYGESYAIKSDVNALSLGVRAGGAVSDSINLYARLGVSSWDSDATFTVADSWGRGSVPISDSGADLYYGVGAEFSLSSQWAITAEYSGLETELKEIEMDIKVTTLNLGVAFYF
jgi:OmpA-OmpF porin, OOP family